jgi:hypothetical protein
MAIGWLTVLKTVPWGDVISNAPKVADGAKKLWSSVGRKLPTAQPVPSTENPEVAAREPGLAELQLRLATVEARAAELHEQMRTSSELIQALADQNTQLVAGLQTSRVRLRWLAGATLVLGLLAAVGLAFGLMR